MAKRVKVAWLFQELLLDIMASVGVSSVSFCLNDIIPLLVCSQIKSEKLEATKTEAKAALVAKVGSLLGSGKLKELEADNRTLQGEVAARDESIELLQKQMERQQEEHSHQLVANWWNCKPSTAGKWRTRKRHTKRKCHS